MTLKKDKVLLKVKSLLSKGFDKYIASDVFFLQYEKVKNVTRSIYRDIDKAKAAYKDKISLQAYWEDNPDILKSNENSPTEYINRGKCIILISELIRKGLYAGGKLIITLNDLLEVDNKKYKINKLDLMCRIQGEYTILVISWSGDVHD